MGQVFISDQFGKIEFEKTWINSDVHIGELTKGGYAHISGLPISSRDEIITAITSGKDLDKALYWFDHMDSKKEDTEKGVIIRPDGSIMFEDGTEIENIADILCNIPPGHMQDAAMMWWAEKLKKESGKKIEIPAIVDNSEFDAVENLELNSARKKK